jgi:hypothetical protein
LERQHLRGREDHDGQHHRSDNPDQLMPHSHAAPITRAVINEREPEKEGDQDKRLPDLKLS